MGIGVEFEGLLVVADGGIGHALLLALLAQQGVFGGQTFERLFALGLLGLQGLNLDTLTVDDLQFATDVAQGDGLLQVVAAVDGLDETVEEGGEVASVEGHNGIVVFAVGLALLHSLADERLVVVAAGELYHLAAHEDVLLADGGHQRDALEGGAAREGHIGLSAGKGSASEVDLHLVEGEALTLVHGDGPSQAEGELGVGAQQLLFDLLLLLIEGVAHVLPHLALHIVVAAFFGLHGDDALVLVDLGDDAQRAVDPALLLVVLDEDDLCAGFYTQFHGRGQRRLGKLAIGVAEEQSWGAVEPGKALFVDVVHGVAAGGQGDGQLAALRAQWRLDTPVEGVEVTGRDVVLADAVEEADELVVALAVDLAKFDADQLHLLPHLAYSGDSRSPIPMISVHSVGDLLYRRQS